MAAPISPLFNPPTAAVGITFKENTKWPHTQLIYRFKQWAPRFFVLPPLRPQAAARKGQAHRVLPLRIWHGLRPHELMSFARERANYYLWAGGIFHRKRA